MTEPVYSVLDIETTGFSPQMGDRIVEISIVNINGKGEILDSYETLVNPRRDVGASWVHGITPDMVMDAPTIGDIRDDILDMIQHNVVVAHNAPFDLRFLNFELSRIAPELPEISGLCTLELSRTVVPELPSHKLPLLCEYFDIRMVETHSAYYDSVATAELFTCLLERYVDKYGWNDFHRKYIEGRLFSPALHGLQPRRFEYKRSKAIQYLETEHNRLQRMLLRLPESYSNTTLPYQQYLDILDEVLADRMITEEESEKLLQLSEEFHLARKDVLDIHEEYLRRLTRVYLADQTLSEPEFQDLAIVSKILGIDDRVNRIIDLEKAQLPSQTRSDAPIDLPDLQGKTICFTGELCSKLDGRPISRPQAQAIVLQKGMIPKSGVSSKLDFLVVADPHTQSGKAQKARELGVKILAEAVFWGMVGVQVE
jgi:DNA polymerase-3 subunit epsilon